MKIRNLAEAIILQSLDDLHDPLYRRDCLSFFFGGSFRHCAEMAGMRTSEMLSLMGLVKKSFSTLPWEVIQPGQPQETDVSPGTLPKDTAAYPETQPFH